MHYKQRDGHEYHYISDPDFQRIFEKSWEYPYNKHIIRSPYMLLLHIHEKEYPVLRKFDSGDSLKEGDYAYEMEAILYDYDEDTCLLQLRDLYYDFDKVRCFEPRYFFVSKEDAE